MKVDFKQVLHNLEGKPIQMDGKDLTLELACTDALVVDYQGHSELPGADKKKRWDYAKKISKNPSLDLVAEDIAWLKQLLAKRWPTHVLGPAWDLLDPPAETPAS